ncbi:hypothetical protein BJF90_35115 [Pseudonocardia sp. CNS-004]|nr:hypothetical protein BJF90_35115 [Pseudonocardia sp. CNS-004]
MHWHDVPRTLTTRAEKVAAQELATSDPRLAHALADPDRFGFAQTLAGAHELLEHYQTAPECARFLLEAAADARRLGHRQAPTAPLLRALTLALWREEHGPTHPPDSWFAQGLDVATRPLRSDDGVRALIPLDDPDTDNTDPAGYGLADYLEQHLTYARRVHPVSDRVWEA